MGTVADAVAEIRQSLTNESIDAEIASCMNQPSIRDYISHANDYFEKRGVTRTKMPQSYFIRHQGIYLPLKAIGRMARLKSGNKDIHTHNFFHPIDYARALKELGYDIQHQKFETLPTQPPAKDTPDREKTYTLTLVRPYQAAFREKILNYYGAKCVLTGCDVRVALEASHITPYAERQDNSVYNGLPLRRDIHRLFDENSIVIDPENFKVTLNDSIAKYYADQILKVADIKPHLRTPELKHNLVCRLKRTA